MFQRNKTTTKPLRPHPPNSSSRTQPIITSINQRNIDIDYSPRENINRPRASLVVSSSSRPQSVSESHVYKEPILARRTISHSFPALPCPDFDQSPPPLAPAPTTSPPPPQTTTRAWTPTQNQQWPPRTQPPPPLLLPTHLSPLLHPKSTKRPAAADSRNRLPQLSLAKRSSRWQKLLGQRRTQKQRKQPM